LAAFLGAVPISVFTFISLFLSSHVIFAVAGGIRSCPSIKLFSSAVWRDPETRYTSGGQAVANFSMATDESYKDKNGERQKTHRVAQESSFGANKPKSPSSISRRAR